MEANKYRALKEDKEIVVNLLTAIFKQKKALKKISIEAEMFIEKEVLRMRMLGLNNRQIREKLGITQYRVVQVLKENLIWN